MPFDNTQPHIFIKNWTYAYPNGGIGCFSYAAGAIVTDPQLLMTLNFLGAPIVSTTANAGV